MKSNVSKTSGETANYEAWTPWNKGKALGQKSPFTKDRLDFLRAELTAAKRLRDVAFLNTGIDTMLRPSDLLRLTVADVTDHLENIRKELTIRQQKTQVGHVVALSEKTGDSIHAWITHSKKSGTDFLWTSLSNRKTGRPITRESYGEFVKEWCEIMRLDPRRHSTHSVRRSKSALIYARTHNLKAIQLLLGHKSIASTAHYLGVEQREALDLAKGLEL